MSISVWGVGWDARPGSDRESNFRKGVHSDMDSEWGVLRIERESAWTSSDQLMQDNRMMDIVDGAQQAKSFGPSGLYRERHADVYLPDVASTESNNGVFSEAPSKLASDSCKEICLPKRCSFSELLPGDIDMNPDALSRLMKVDHHGRVQSSLWKQSSFSCDLDREEAWKRKQDLYLMEQITNMAGEATSRTVGRSASDCDSRTWPRPGSKSRPRTRSLTDEDLEELRGCIDLGFGFTFNESCDLRSTLPALDLYYAINRQYNDIKCRYSPVSTLDDRILDRSFSGGSPCSPFSDTWKISSPGDHPNQVKTRLRHWAQAVACSIRESF